MSTKPEEKLARLKVGGTYLINDSSLSTRSELRGEDIRHKIVKIEEDRYYTEVIKEDRLRYGLPPYTEGVAGWYNAEDLGESTFIIKRRVLGGKI